LKIKATLGRVALFVIVSVMLILVQNSGAFAATTFPGSAEPFTFTHPNANLSWAITTGIDVPVVGRSHLTSFFMVHQHDVEILQ
jgi:hypothetical protein